MGVPDLLKFVARCTPRCMQSIPQQSSNGSQKPISFDYVLVDATNAHQTVGLEKLRKNLLFNPSVNIKKGVVLVVDGQRKRRGSAREYRTVTMSHQLDVDVARLGEDIKAKFGDDITVHISTRSAPGEGDYKLLSIHRAIIAKHLKEKAAAAKDSGDDAAAAALNATVPSFLFVSEDSDVVCGAMCGPYPASVTVATTLHDTLFDFGLLRVQEVLCFVGEQADVLLFNQNDNSASSGGNKQLSFVGGEPGEVDPLGEEVESKPAGGLKPPAPRPIGVGDLTYDAEEELPDEPGRRKKVDGPMKSSGLKITFSDDDSDQEAEETKKDDESAEKKVAEEEEDEEAAKDEAAATRRAIPTGVKAKPAKPANPLTVPAKDTTTSSYLLQSCLDFVFLFTLVKGNGVAPALTKGATKVDIASLWKAYCGQKYSTSGGDGFGASQEVGAFLTITKNKKKRSIASKVLDDESVGSHTVTVNTKFLHDVLSAISYSDAQAVVEERHHARDFLKYVVYTVFRYVTGNLTDTRDEVGAVTAPTLASLMHVLAARDTRTYTFSLFEAPVFANMPNVGAEEQGSGAQSSATLDSIGCTAATTLTSVATGATPAPSGAGASSGFGSFKLPKRAVIRSGNAVTRVGPNTGLLGGAGGIGNTGNAITGGSSIIASRDYAADLATIRAAVADAQDESDSDSDSDDDRDESKKAGQKNKNQLGGIADLYAIWQYTVAAQVPLLQKLARRARKLNESGKEAKTPANHNPGKLTTAAQPQKGHFSFELRRMMPVSSTFEDEMQSSDDDEEDVVAADVEKEEGSRPLKRKAEEKKDNNNHQLADQLGLSYSYFSGPAKAETLGPVPKKKRKEMERQQRQAEAAVRKEQKEAKAKKPKRLGKKERQKLKEQKEKEEAATTGEKGAEKDDKKGGGDDSEKPKAVDEESD